MLGVQRPTVTNAARELERKASSAVGRRSQSSTGRAL
jgi:hypothetical protein